MIIRHESPADHAAISELHHRAFLNHPYATDPANPSEPDIVLGLRAAGALSLSLVTELDGRVVAHLALSPAPVGEDTQGWYLLGPIGVLPELQRKGLGSTLLREALAQLRRQGALGVVLVGEPTYYQRFGFRSHPGLTYTTVPEQYVLGLAFTPRPPRGSITAHAAFDC